MAFDPSAFESLEARQKALAGEEDRAQIDSRIAEMGIDTQGALNAMYGNIPKVDDGEVRAAQQEEAQEQDPDILLAKLEGIEEDEGNSILVGDGGKDILIGDTGEDILQENTERQRVEHPMTPSIVHLRRSKKIDETQESELIEHFANNGSMDDIGTLESMKDAQNLQEVKDLLKDRMNQDEGITEKNIESFTETTSDTLEIEKNEKGGYVNQTDTDAVNLLGGNFVIIDTGDKEKDTEHALDTAFATAHNKLIDGKQFPRDVTYEENSKIVTQEGGNLTEKYEAFKKNMLHVETHQALGGKKDKEAMREGAEEKLNTAGLNEAFYTALEQFKRVPEGPEQIELAQELEALRIEAKLTEGEATLLAGGELDRVSDTLGESTSQTA